MPFKLYFMAGEYEPENIALSRTAWWRYAPVNKCIIYLRRYPLNNKAHLLKTNDVVS